MKLAFAFKQPDFIGMMTGKPWQGGMPHRQYLTWHAWLRDQWNEPDRGDWYLMQIIADIRSYLSRTEIQADRCKIVHNWKIEKPFSLRDKERMLNEMAERRSMAALGIEWEIPSDPA